MAPCSLSIAPSTPNDEYDKCISSQLMMGEASSSLVPPPTASVINPMKCRVAYPSLVQMAPSIVLERADQDVVEQATNDVVAPSNLCAANQSQANSPDLEPVEPVPRRTSDVSTSSLQMIYGARYQNDSEASCCPQHCTESKSTRNGKKRLRFDTRNIQYVTHISSPWPSSSLRVDEHDMAHSASLASPAPVLSAAADSYTPSVTSAQTSPTSTASLSDAQPADTTTWWTRDELRSFKEAAMRTCRKVRKRPAFTTCLDVAYQSVSSLPGSDSSSPTSLPPNESSSLSESSSSTVSSSHEKELHDLLHRGLAKWSTRGHSCRGLERRSSRYHFETRGQDIASARKAVLDEQQSCHRRTSPTKRRKVSLDNDSHVFAQEDNFQEAHLLSTAVAENIQRVSMRRTERAKLFALMMGQADAVAVGRN